MKLLVIAVLAAGALGAVLMLRRGSLSSQNGVVARVIDGDTIVLRSGTHVRLVQIDTPEKLTECYGQAASAITRRLLSPATQVRIEPDPHLDQVDRYGRRLAYVWKGDEDVNLDARPTRRRGRLVLPQRPRTLRRCAPGRGRAGSREAPRPVGGVSASGLRPNEFDVERPRALADDSHA